MLVSRYETPVAKEETPLSAYQSSSTKDKAIIARVFEFIERQPGLKGREIADQLDMDRSQVNGIIYGPLEDLIEQDRHFGWRVIIGKNLSDGDEGNSDHSRTYQKENKENDWLTWIIWAIVVALLYMWSAN